VFRRQTRQLPNDEARRRLAKVVPESTVSQELYVCFDDTPIA